MYETPRVIVVNNDHPASEYGANRLADVFSSAFEPEVVTPECGFRGGPGWLASHGARALVLSGSERSVTERESWMLEEEELLRAVVDAGVPVLAICFGHQLLAEAFGADLVTREKQTGLFEIRSLGDDPVFEGAGETMIVPEQHSDQVAAVPRPFALIATSDYCPVQVMRHVEAPAVYGMQFHPCYAEGVFEADEEWAELGLEGPFRHDGELILRNAVRIMRESLR